MKKSFLFIITILFFLNNLNAQVNAPENLLKKVSFEESNKMAQNPSDYNNVVLEVANYVYNTPLESINPKNGKRFKSYLSAWLNKTEEYWFNFKKPAGAYSITENQNNFLLYLACNAKYCLENPDKGKKGDEEETNYQAFLLFISYFESDKVKKDHRSHYDIQKLIKAKEDNGLKDFVNGRAYIPKQD